MSEPDDFIDAKLAQLARATEDVVPTAAFDDWVAAAVGRESGVVWFESVWRTGRVALLVGALAAAASVVLAMNARIDLDEQVMANFEMVELAE
ncbi:MAG: hypothetical protein JRI23_10615 [Deltaproteobacteria bacterium]|jgi:hypothetical protein|nr:hypothetical protein [Deltaproteobacteria bacterium]MBW2532129.1 hypothetical protein [Deltaproteobacteria bacterium]